MILIKKQSEPVALTGYKKQKWAYYEGIPSAIKTSILESLLEEQGCVCAYCMKRISTDDMTIEHYISQSADKSKTLDYQNMLGVCFGNRGKKEEEQTCDAHRGNSVLVVDPLIPAKVQQIKYKSDGTIYSDDLNINRNLNEDLNLNCDVLEVSLKKNRKEALDAFIKWASKDKAIGAWTKEFLLKQKEQLRKMDKQLPYCGIIYANIDRRLSRL